MPGKHGFTSKAQQGKIFAMQSRGELPRGTAERMAGETPSMKKLPQYKYSGGLVGQSERQYPNRFESEQYGGSVSMTRARGGEIAPPHPGDFAYRTAPDELLARHAEDEYGGPVDINKAYGGYAYGGTSDGDEALARHPEDEYGGPVDMAMMKGGPVTCPHCGHEFAHGGNVGRHMQPGYQDMDPEKADMEADMHLGKALMRQKSRHFEGGGEVDPRAVELYKHAIARKKGP